MAKKRSVSTLAAQPMMVSTPDVAMLENNNGLMKSLDVCIPVCVYSYNRRQHTVIVLPLVKQMFYRHKWRAVRKEPFEVSIRSIQCGGFCIDYPVFIGDTGWVFSSDRSTSFLKDEDAPTSLVLGKDRELAVVRDKLPQPPRQPLVHMLHEGFFLPDSWAKWEYSRFKDASGVRLSDSLYIGTSFFDEDEEKGGLGSDADSEDILEDSTSDSESVDSSDDDSDADDGTYEGNPSASIVMTRNGIIHIMASSKEKAKRHAHFKLKKDGIKVTLVDDSNKDKIWKKAVMSLNLDNGIEIDCKGDHQSNSFTLDKDGLEMKFKSDNAKDGKDAILKMTPTFDIDISTPSDIKLSANNITTECKNITTIGENTNFNVTSVMGNTTKVTINASETIDLRALGNLSLASSKKVFIGSAEDVAIGTVGGAVSIETNNGDLTINTGSGKLDFKGGGCIIKADDGTLTLQGNEVAISCDRFALSTSIGISNDMQFLNNGKLVIM